MPIEPIQSMGAAEAEGPAVHKAKAAGNRERSVSATTQPPEGTPHPAQSQPHEEEVQRVLDGQRIVYRFVDKATNTVIFQVPSEQVLNVMRGIEEQLQQQNNAKKIDEHL